MFRFRYIAAFVAVIVALCVATFVGTGKAQADPTGNETCGGSQTSNDDWAYNNFIPNKWAADNYYRCGDGKTFTWEIQHTTNGGATFGDWFGSGNEIGFRSGPGCSNGCTDTQSNAGSCAYTGSYRIVVNINSGPSWTGVWSGAGYVCDGYLVTD